jgi:hypothetical protein
MLIFTKILTASLLAAVSLSGGPGDPLKIKPVQTMAGGDSNVHFPMVRTITNDKMWKELWAMHKGLPITNAATEKTATPDPTKLPTVDFDKNQVLVVFGGKLPDVQAYEYAKTYDKDGVAVVQLNQNVIPASTAKSTFYPFILMVVPKEPVRIRIELDSIAKDGSHFWMQIASFPILKETKPSG